MCYLLFRRTHSKISTSFLASCKKKKKANSVKAHVWSKTFQPLTEAEGKQYFWKGSKFIVFTVSVCPPASTELQKPCLTRNIKKLITKIKNICQSFKEFKKQEINCWNYTNTVLLKYTLNLFLRWQYDMIIFHNDLLHHVNNWTTSVLAKNIKIQFQCCNSN